MKNLQTNRRQSRLRRRVIAQPTRTDADRTAISEVLGYPVQAKLKVGAPDDAHEREADAVADRVLAMPEPTLQRKCENCAEEDQQEQKSIDVPKPEKKEEEVQRKPTTRDTPATGAAAAAISATKGGSTPLRPNERVYFEPRLGADLSQVRVHADAEAARLAAGLSARAFTTGHDIYFGAGEYQPGLGSGRKLLAHELAHVLQQRRGDATTLRRVIELRPPGRGEASAFDRAQELVDRLNRLTTALQYRLDGRVLRYDVLDETRLNEFDRQMRVLMDQAAVLPMRLITGSGLVQASPGAPFEPALHDTWTAGYVDLDDLMASDDLGFKTQLVHFLTERAQTRDYARRIGSFPSTPATVAEFERAHRAGYEAEARVLQDEIGDPTIRYLYSEERPPGTWVVAFKSNEGYRIFKVFRNYPRNVVPAETWAQSKDGRRLTIAQLIESRRTRAAAVPAP